MRVPVAIRLFLKNQTTHFPSMAGAVTRSCSGILCWSELWWLTSHTALPVLLGQPCLHILSFRISVTIYNRGITIEKYASVLHFILCFFGKEARVLQSLGFNYNILPNGGLENICCCMRENIFLLWMELCPPTMCVLKLSLPMPLCLEMR